MAAADAEMFRWWARGEVLLDLPIDQPVLESWDAAGSSSQQRLAVYLETLAPATLVVESLAEPGWLDLDVVLPPSQGLLAGSDVENFLTPVVRRLDPRRFVLVTGRKRHPASPGERSRLRLGTAVRGQAPLAPYAMRVEGSYGNVAWKHAIRDYLHQASATLLQPGPLALTMGFRCSTDGRNWLSLWKPAGDALGPLVGEPRPTKPFHPADDRITDLALHLDATPGLGWSVGLAVRCDPASKA